MRRFLGPLLLGILIVGVGYAIYYSSKEVRREKERAQLEKSLIEVKGITGSEKYTLLTDERTREIFKKHGLVLKVEKAGSREIAIKPNLDRYDFAFPAGIPSAQKIRERFKNSRLYTPFYTPMTIASWKPIAEILIKNGIVEKQNDFYYIIDMKSLLNLVVNDARWKDLKENDVYRTNKSILITTTDVRKSNSAAMYLALVSYLMNNENVITTQEEIDRHIAFISKLFLKQGFTETTTAGPFEDYISMGMGKAPLVFIYEAQFIEFLMKNRPLPDMTLLYPKPTIFTKHTLVALNEKGDKVGKILEEDPDMQRLIIEYGYRTNKQELVKEIIMERGIHIPENIIDVVDPPSYEIMEKMIQAIEKHYQ